MSGDGLFTDDGVFVFRGPNVAISCTVEFDRDAERYVAKGSGWIGFSDRSAIAAALNCFKGWMTGEGAYFEGMEYAEVAR